MILDRAEVEVEVVRGAIELVWREDRRVRLGLYTARDCLSWTVNASLERKCPVDHARIRKCSGCASQSCTDEFTGRLGILSSSFDCCRARSKLL